MKTKILYFLLGLPLVFIINRSIAQDADRYWIYEDFSAWGIEADYITEETVYDMSPNDIGLKTYYANFEATEGSCQNESSAHLRIRGLQDGGWVEFTIPDAYKVTIKVKGKSTSADRSINIYRNGTLIKIISDLDRDNCAVFTEEINTDSEVTYKISGGDDASTKPVVITSIIVEKYDDDPVEQFNVNSSVNPANSGSVTGGGVYDKDSEVILTAITNNGYEFVNWTSDNEILSTENSFTFTIVSDISIVANFKLKDKDPADADLYWIYENFLTSTQDTDYITGENSYVTEPNNVLINTYYANIEATEGECQNESAAHLRIRGLQDGGRAEFTVPNANKVTINIKGKSTSLDRSINIYRDGSLIETISGLDRDNCSVFTDEIYTYSEVTYKITGGDDVSTKPVVITSVIVEKYTSNNSIENFEDVVSIDIFPNPVKDILNIEIPEILKGQKAYIYNATGICVMIYTLDSENSINVGSLSQGIYFLSMIIDGHTISKKFVKK